MNDLYLLLGSNEGNRLLEISKSIVLIYKYIGKIINRSMLYETEPWGFKSKDDFINLALHVKTGLMPNEVLHKIKQIEFDLGRKIQQERYSSRKIDIDIIFYNNEIINKEGLIIPHEHMHKRKFVLEPLNEICPEYKHPVFRKTINALLEECPDKRKVVMLRK